jgi:hypothetical protein
LTTFIDHRPIQRQPPDSGQSLPYGPARSRRDLRPFGTEPTRAINKQASLREAGDSPLPDLRREIMNHLNRTRQKGARRVQGRRKDHLARGGLESRRAKDPSFLALF